MKFILPLLVALAGLGAGVGAGVALRPPAEADAEDCGDEACPDAVAAETAPPAATGGSVDYVSFDKPFIVPVFETERVVAMVVVSLSLEVPSGHAASVLALQPRLRDGFLGVMFRHANSGGFEGSFTAGQKMADLKSALLAAVREVAAGVPVSEVLVTEIVRQDV